MYADIALADGGSMQQKKLTQLMQDVRHMVLNDVDNRNDSIRLDNKCKTNVVARRPYHAYGQPLLLK